MRFKIMPDAIPNHNMPPQANPVLLVQFNQHVAQANQQPPLNQQARINPQVFQLQIAHLQPIRPNVGGHG